MPVGRLPEAEPSVALIAIGSTLLALVGSAGFVFVRRHNTWSRSNDTRRDEARRAMARCWQAAESAQPPASTRANTELSTLPPVRAIPMRRPCQR